MHTVHLLRFGTFELDLHSRELRNGPTAVRLQRQPFEILCLMLEHRETVVTREQVRRRCGRWSGTIVRSATGCRSRPLSPAMLRNRSSRSLQPMSVS